MCSSDSTLLTFTFFPSLDLVVFVSSISSWGPPGTACSQNHTVGMALVQSPHLNNIPQAVRIAASVDPALDPALKQQAIDYLSEVRDRCEETWQVIGSL